MSVTEDFAAKVSDVGALAEPARRALYLFVVAQPEPVSRDQAAVGVDLPRHTAKFHLDRLVDAGLLETEFRRLSGRRGPGAGRPAKLYRRADRQVTVNLPERQYELAGQILADAIADASTSGGQVRESVSRAAAEAGKSIVVAALAAEPAAQTSGPPSGQPSGPTPGPTPGHRSLIDVLAVHGYEPRREGDVVVLANCPFHCLAERHTELVCTMNHELITAAADALGEPVEVRLDPAPGRCCVTLRQPAGTADHPTE